MILNDENDDNDMTASIWSRLIDLVAPRACAICGRRLAIGEEVLCASCNLHLPRTNHAESPSDNPLAHRFWGLLPVERAAALFYYEPHSVATRVIKEMKYHDHPEYGLFLGRLTAQEFSHHSFFEGIDAIVPIPLARRRQRQRGFNQSLEIARGIGEATGIPVVNDAVRRISFTNSQALSSHQEREVNVENAFELVSDDAIRNRHVLLVDDIVTTGATMRACLQQLQKGGAEKLSILCLAYTKE